MRRFLLPLAVFAVFAAPRGAAAADMDPALLGLGDDKLMQEVCKTVVARYPEYEIVGTGSWCAEHIDGRRYIAGKSDHDMRLILKNAPANMSDRELADAWNQANRRFVLVAREKLGTAKAGQLLKRTNIYAPEAFGQGVENAQQMAAKFQEFNVVPDVLHQGPVDAAKAEAAAGDGIFGPEAAGWRQAYEGKTGKTFYSYNGKGFAGKTDLTHMAEGFATFSVSGSGKTAADWVRMAGEAVEKGNSASAAKYLNRVYGDLNKARGALGIGADAQMNAEIKGLLAKLGKAGVKMADLADDLKPLLKQCAAQAEFFRTVDLNNPRQAALVANLMEKARWDASRLGKINAAFGKALDKVSGKLSEYANKIPTEQLMTVMTTISLTLAAKRFGAEPGADEDNEAEIAYSVMIREVASFASLPAGLAASITQDLLDGAKGMGIRMMSDRQEATDLIAGIFTVGGRETAILDNDMSGYTIDQLVERIPTEKKLRSIVENLAGRAASRGIQGGALAKTDKKVAEDVFRRCYPVILDMWKEKRMEFAMEYAGLAESLMRGNFKLTYAPNPVEIQRTASGAYKPVKATVSVRALGYGTGGVTLNDLGAKLERMAKIVRILTGDPTVVSAVNVIFRTGGGVDGAWDGEKVYTFDEPGDYEIEARVSMFVDGQRLIGDESMGALRFDEDFPMVVVVEVAEKDTTPRVKIAGPREVPYALKAGETFVLHKFEATATPAGKYRLSWLFGDGTGRTEKELSPAGPAITYHKYQEGKIYTATLRLMNDNGVEVARDAVKIAVFAPPEPPPQPAKPKVAPPDPVAPDDGQGAWVLVDTITESREPEENKDRGDQWTERYQWTASPGRYTFSHTYTSNRKPPPPEEKYTAVVSWSKPPSRIREGEVVTLRGSANFTDVQHTRHINGVLGLALIEGIGDREAINKRHKRHILVRFNAQNSTDGGKQLDILLGGELEKHRTTPAAPRQASGSFQGKMPLSKYNTKTISITTGLNSRYGGVFTSYIYEWRDAAPKKEVKPESDEYVWLLTDIVCSSAPDEPSAIFTNRVNTIIHRQIATRDSAEHRNHNGIGEFFEGTARFSTPPAILRAGETITIKLNLTQTGGNWHCTAMSCRARVDTKGRNPNFKRTKGAEAQDPHCKNCEWVAIGNNASKEDRYLTSVDAEFEDTVPEGHRSALAPDTYEIIPRMSRAMTRYIYEWTPVGEATPKKITPRTEKWK